MPEPSLAVRASKKYEDLHTETRSACCTLPLRDDVGRSARGADTEHVERGKFRPLCPLTQWVLTYDFFRFVRRPLLHSPPLNLRRGNRLPVVVGHRRRWPEACGLRSRALNRGRIG